MGLSKQFPFQLLSILSYINRYQKILLWGLSTALLTALAFLIYEVTAVHYVPLLPPGYSQSINNENLKKQLDATGVSYKINSHSTILVPEKQQNAILTNFLISESFKSIQNRTDFDATRNAEMIFERHLKGKIDELLAAIVGIGNYHTTVQAIISRDKIEEERKTFSERTKGNDLGKPVVIDALDKNQQTLMEGNPSSWISGLQSKISEGLEINKNQQSEQVAVPFDYIKITSSPGKIENISIGVLINRRILSALDSSSTLPSQADHLIRELQSQLITILKGYNVKIHQAVNLVDFYQYPNMLPTPEGTSMKAETSNFIAWIAVFFSTAALFLVLVGSWGRFPSMNPVSPGGVAMNDEFYRNPLDETINALQKQYHTNPNKMISTLSRWMHEETHHS